MSSLAGQNATVRRPRDPDDRGYFGRYGGRYVPETLVAPVEALEQEYLRAHRVRDHAACLSRIDLELDPVAVGVERVRPVREVAGDRVAVRLNQ